MTQDFAQNFVRLRRCGLAAESLSELRFNHAECRLNIRAFVIVRQKLFALEVVEVEKFCPDNRLRFVARLCDGVRLERDVRHCAVPHCGVNVGRAQVCFVGGNFRHLEATLRGLINERFELVVIASVSLSDFNACHDISFDAAHQMNFNPFFLFHLFAILRVKPAQEMSRSEAG